MKRQLLGLCGAVWLAMGARERVSAAQQKRVQLLGHLRSRHTEAIYPPLDGAWSFKITYLAPEGARVAAGTVVARMQGEGVERQLRELESQLTQVKLATEQKLQDIQTQIDGLVQQIATLERDLAILGVNQASNAAAAWVVAARERQIAALDRQEKRLTLRLTREQLTRKRALLAAAETSTAEKLAAIEAQVEEHRRLVEASERVSKQAGVVIYKRTPWNRSKPKPGIMVYRGTPILEIVDDRALFVEAYLREVDHATVEPGMPVEVTLLGRREIAVAGQVERISAIVLPVRDWDRSLPESHAMFDVRAFKVVIGLDHVPSEAKPDGAVRVQTGVGGAAHGR